MNGSTNLNNQWPFKRRMHFERTSLNHRMKLEQNTSKHRKQYIYTRCPLAIQYNFCPQLGFFTYSGPERNSVST